MRLLSFNVNGVRACAKKTLCEDLTRIDADVICLQETKATPEQVSEALSTLDGYHIEAHDAQKRGYSGTAVLSKDQPLTVTRGIGIEEHDQEGRVITTEWPTFYLVNVYVPNSSAQCKRLPYRVRWDQAFFEYLNALEQVKPVVICGDLNVARRAIDLARPKENYNKSPGFMQDEIDGIDRYIEKGHWMDSFRVIHPERIKYSWWSYRAGARARNVGWRIDYFLVSSKLKDQIKDADLLNDVYGSDHCPVYLELET